MRTYIYRNYIDPYPIIEVQTFEEHIDAMNYAIVLMYSTNTNLRVDCLEDSWDQHYYFIMPESPGDNYRPITKNK